MGRALPTFQSALAELSTDPGAQRRCLDAAQELARLLQALINRLNRP
jgi:hypothetical protein